MTSPKAKRWRPTIIVLGVAIAAIVVVSYPSIRRARLTAHAIGVMKGPIVLDMARDQYRLQHDKSPNDKVAREDLLPYLKPYLRNGYLFPFYTPFGDEIQLSTVGARLKIPYPSWKKLGGVVETNFFAHPIETEAEYKARVTKN
jgi:hypothetical protein